MTSTELITKRDELANKREFLLQSASEYKGAIVILNELIEKVKVEEVEVEKFKDSITRKLEEVCKVGKSKRLKP